VRGGYRSCRTRLLDIPTQGERGSRMPRGGSGDRYTLACADWRVDMPLPWPKPTWLPVKYSKHFVASAPDIVAEVPFPIALFRRRALFCPNSLFKNRLLLSFIKVIR